MKLKLTLAALVLGAPALQADPRSALVALGAVPYRAGRWVYNMVKGPQTIELGARELLQKLNIRYGKLNTVMANKEIDHAHFVQLVGEAHQDYLAQEGAIIKFARKHSCCSDYDEIMNYPFMHFINRTQAILAWVKWYQGKVQNLKLGELNKELQTCSENLVRLLAYARASEEYANEAALLPKDRWEGRKSTLYFLMVKLPILTAGMVATGAAVGAFMLYRMFTRSNLGQQLRAAANDVGDVARAAGNMAAQGIQELRDRPEVQEGLRRVRNVNAGRQPNDNGNANANAARPAARLPRPVNIDAGIDD